MNIAIQLLLTTLTGASPASTQAPDLCDVVHRETGTPTICQPHEIGAPVYDGEVCCAGGSCFPASGDGCLDTEVLYYCELGEAQATGEVDCYFEVPDYCDVHPCASGIDAGPLEEGICCNQGVCWHIETGSHDCELEDIYWCNVGVSNDDGTVTCLDPE